MPGYNPRPRPNARNLQQLLTQGGLRVVTTLIDLGYGGIVLTNYLLRAFPNALAQSLRALSRIGREESEILHSANSGQSTGQVRPPSGYRNRDITDAYRYRFRVPYTLPNGTHSTTVVTVDTSRLLSAGDFLPEVQAAMQLFEAHGLPTCNLTVLDTMISGPIVLIAVERGIG